MKIIWAQERTRRARRAHLSSYIFLARAVLSSACHAGYTIAMLFMYEPSVSDHPKHKAKVVVYRKVVGLNL